MTLLKFHTTLCFTTITVLIMFKCWTIKFTEGLKWMWIFHLVFNICSCLLLKTYITRQKHFNNGSNEQNIQLWGIVSEASNKSLLYWIYNFCNLFLYTYWGITRIWTRIYKIYTNQCTKSEIFVSSCRSLGLWLFTELEFRHQRKHQWIGVIDMEFEFPAVLKSASSLVSRFAQERLLHVLDFLNR